MKKTLIAAVLLAGLATSGMAQEKANRTRHGGQNERSRNRIESPEQQARLATDRMDKQLSLTDKQKSEVYRINLDRAKNMSVAREKAQKQRLQEWKKMESERADNEKRLNRVLNNEQQAKYASLKKSREEKFKNRKGRFDKKKGVVAKRDSSNRGRTAARSGK